MSRQVDGERMEDKDLVLFSHLVCVCARLYVFVRLRLLYLDRVERMT